jgi:hypothetical protein
VLTVGSDPRRLQIAGKTARLSLREALGDDLVVFL